MNYGLLYYKRKRPNKSKEIVLKEIIAYIKDEYEKGHIPSKRELQNNFHLRLDIKIGELYEKAGLKYKLAANQSIKSEKADILLKLIIKNLDKFGLELIEARNVRQRGIDIVARKKEKRIGIELKAYNKFEKIKNRNIKQCERFARKENLSKVMMISTSDLIEMLKVPDFISIIKYRDLIKVIKNRKDLDRLNYIRNTSINLENATKKITKQKILDYVYNKYKIFRMKPSYLDIQRDLNVNLYSYFGSLFEIYKILRIAPPTKNMGGPRAKNPDKECINLWKEDFKKFILEEIKNGKKYPSGFEIGKHFGIKNIWNIVKVSELYKEAGLKPYLERGKSSRIMKSTFG